MTVTLSQLEAADEACQHPGSEGYEEYQFLQAFDDLCKQAGGYKAGMELAKKLIQEQVQ